jgi:hypothetical protein
MNKRNAGYTSIELMINIIGVATVVGFVAGLYVLCHFLAKFW